MTARARLVGVNHVALEVDDVDAALDWYGRIFELTLRGRSPGMAFVDMGDQFLAISEGRRQPPDDGRHFGLVVDDKEAARQRLVEAEARLAPGRRLDFYSSRNRCWSGWSSEVLLAQPDIANRWTASSTASWTARTPRIRKCPR